MNVFPVVWGLGIWNVALTLLGIQTEEKGMEKVDVLRRVRKILEVKPRVATVVVSRFSFVTLLLVVLNQNCTGSKRVEAMLEPRNYCS